MPLNKINANMNHISAKKNRSLRCLLSYRPNHSSNVNQGDLGEEFFWHFHVISTGHPIIFCHLTLPPFRSQAIQLVEVIQRLSAEVIHPLSVAVIVSLCLSVFHILFTATGRICTDPGASVCGGNTFKLSSNQGWLRLCTI